MDFALRVGTVDAASVLKTAISRETRNKVEFFADMREAFNNLKRKEIWRMPEKM